MTSSLAGRRPVLFLAVIIAILLVAAYLHFVINTKPASPRLLVMSPCGQLQPKMRRIGSQSGFQFDVPTSDLSISEGAEDTPPFAYGFILKPRNGFSVMNISFRHRPMDTSTMDPVLTFSKHVEKRDVVDNTGESIGDDYWGYLNAKERWRRVRLFKGGVFAKYDSADMKESALFDRVLNSGCVLSGVKAP
jgi:hypothetical protein